MISTHNRSKELQAAVASAVAQTEPAEVIVIDDGSTDGTAEMIAAHFPQVRLVRHEVSRGYIVRRNEGAALASGRIVFSLDDDAAFSTPEIVGQILPQFDSPVVGAVAIPYVEVTRSPHVYQRAPDAGSVYCTEAFIGTAHAIRRDVFLGLGGYREALVHQGEEGDLCLRMLDAGFVVRLGCADPIHHFESLRRDWRRMDYFGARNALLFAYQNVPFPFVLVHFPATVLKVLVYTLRPSRLRNRLAAVVEAVRARRLHARVPVSRTAYRTFRSLRTGGPKKLEELEPWLGAARSRQGRPVPAG